MRLKNSITRDAAAQGIWTRRLPPKVFWVVSLTIVKIIQCPQQALIMLNIQGSTWSLNNFTYRWLLSGVSMKNVSPPPSNL